MMSFIIPNPSLTTWACDVSAARRPSLSREATPRFVGASTFEAAVVIIAALAWSSYCVVCILFLAVNCRGFGLAAASMDASVNVQPAH